MPGKEALVSRGRPSSAMVTGLLALAALGSYLGWREAGVEAPGGASAPAAPAPRTDPPPARVTVAPLATAPAPAAMEASGYPTDPAALVRALAPLQREVEDALAPVAARCALDGGVLDLSLETGVGDVLVVEARLRAAQEASPADEHDVNAATPSELTEGEALRCVKERIEGAILPVPSARLGRSWRTFYRPPPGPR